MASFQFTDTKNQHFRQNKQDRNVYLQLGLALFEPGAPRAGFLKVRIKPITRIQVRRRPELILNTRTLQIISVFISIQGPGNRYQPPRLEKGEEKNNTLRNKDWKSSNIILILNSLRSRDMEYLCVCNLL